MDSKDSSSTASSPSTEWDSLTPENSVAAAPEAPLPLDASAVQRGNRQFRTVARLDLDGAEQVFSRNCYGAIEKKFNWHQLDRCGGFDAMAVRQIEESADATQGELTYFQSEAAATRYLTAATGHGLPAEQADLRWASVQAAARKIPLPQPAVTETVATDTVNAVNDEVASNTAPLNSAIDSALDNLIGE